MLLVTGAGGQVGRELVRTAPVRGITCMAFTHAELDITDSAAVAAALADGAPDVTVLINLAAYNAVDRAESDPAPAFLVNATAVESLGSICAGHGIPMLHVSTDYVFDGSLDRPYRESDAAQPVNEYGRSKAAGEAALRRVLERHLIVRTAWVFGAAGGNFVTTLLRLAERNEEVRIVADEEGCPTGAAALAETLLTLATRMVEPGFDAWGTYHYCGRPAASRAEFGRVIYEMARARGLPAARVREITAAEFGATAGRPHRTPLDCARIEQIFGIVAPDWRTSLGEMLDELAGSRTA